MKTCLWIALVLVSVTAASAQEQRSAGRRPLKACAVLSAHAGGMDTGRIQDALNLCAPGLAVVLRSDGANTHFQSAPLILPREVTLFIDRGVTLVASRNPRDYDLAPGSCGGLPQGKAASCKPFLFAYQAAFAGVSGSGWIDGQADAWRSAPAGAAIPDLVSSYESQNFHLDGVTLRNAPGIHAAIYKTTNLIVNELKVDSETGSGILLSNVAGGVLDHARIHVPGLALNLKSSILGSTGGIRAAGLQISGGKGVAFGDDLYPGLGTIAFENLHMDHAEPGLSTKGEQAKLSDIHIRQGCFSQPPPAGPWQIESSGCAAGAGTSAVEEVDTRDLPHPGTAGKLTVAQDGSGQFTSIQKALDALPVTGGEIAVKPGTYREPVAIRKPHVHLYGTASDPVSTVIVFNRGPSYAGTFASGTLYVEADDATLDHLTISNDLGVGRGQAVALAVTADRAVFRHLRILGAQDTLFAASRYCYGDYGPCVPARQYFEDSYIEGNTDFIFGDAIAVFERCELHGVPQGSVMYTAQSRHTAEQLDSAYVFDHCRLTGDPRNSAISLGRPWRPYATVIFLYTQIDAPVIPAGWTEWPRFGVPSLPTTTYAEFESTGPGANPQYRAPYSHQLTPEQAEKWSPEKVLGEWKPK